MTNLPAYAKLGVMGDHWDLSDYDRGMLATDMSDGSVARLIGRSERWVRAKRDDMAAIAPLKPVACPPTAIVPLAVVSEPTRPSARPAAPVDPAECARLYLKGYTAREVSGALGCSDTYVLQMLDVQGVPRRGHGTIRTAILDPLPVIPRAALRGPKATNPPAYSSPWKPKAPAEPVPRPDIPPRKLRFARWFHAAKWRTKDIAHLFDLEPDILALALKEGA